MPIILKLTLSSCYIKILFLLFIFKFNFTLSAQETKPTDYLDSIKSYREYNLLEKLYLHTDKSIYNAEETIWFSVYLVDEKNNPLPVNSIAYIELISSIGNEVVERRNIQLIDGLGHGDIELKKEIIKGSYLIRAFTQNMKDYSHGLFFKKQIKIHSQIEIQHQNLIQTDLKKENIDVQFFPEGGGLIEGFSNIVAFKAINQHGIGVNLEGKIINSKGDSVEHFKTTHLGMGKFLLKPEINEKYIALFKYLGNEYEIKLPNPITGGYQMTVNNTSGHIEVIVKCKVKDKMKGSVLIGQSHGEIFSIYEMKNADNHFHFSVAKDSIPHGIAHFTLFDSNGEPHCERLVFIEKDFENNLASISTNKNVYQTRDKVKVNLQLTNNLAVSDIKNISLSVVASGYSNLENGNLNIKNYLLLSSELKGKIENPGYYFNKENPGRLEKLDLLMLTQGWRRFSWKEVIEGNFSRKGYFLEDGFSFQGQLVNYFHRDKPIAGKVSLTFYEEPLKLKEIETDDNGYFLFTGYDILDTVNIIMQSVLPDKNVLFKNKLGNDWVYINMEPTSPELINYIWGTSKPSLPNLINDTIFLYDKETTLIEEVRIIRRKKQLENKTIHNSANFRFSAETDPQINNSPNLFDYLLGQVPQLKVIVNRKGKRIILIRANYSMDTGKSLLPLILLDNLPLDYELIENIDMTEVAYVDILTSGSLAMYGNRAANGVIAIYTNNFVGKKNKTEKYPGLGITHFMHPGYYKAREFYSPKYEQGDESFETDYRTTLFWSPSINFTEPDKSKLSFFTSDIESDYIIQVEGLTNDGQIIYSNYLIRTDNSDP